MFSLQNISILLGLTVFNWVFEIKKWQKLASYTHKISFLKATEQSLGALTASLFTPNRIGEYGAKAFYFPFGVRKKILLLTLLGNMAQMTVTLVLGILGLSLFYRNFNPNFDLYKVFVFFGILLAVLGIFRFQTKGNLPTIKGFSLDKIVLFFKEMPAKLKASTLLLSTLRYAVFSFQFYFLLKIFQVDMSYLDAMTLITSMYLLASIIPTLFIFDVVVKGSIAVYLFDFAGINELVILSTTTLMWLLNFVLPSVFGSYFVLNFNLEPEDA